MAVKKSTSKKAEEVKTTTEAKATPTMGATPFSPSMTLFSNYEIHSLSTAGEQFIKAFREYISNPALPFKLEMKQLNSPANAYVVIDAANKKGFVILFEESMREGVNDILEFIDLKEATSNAKMLDANLDIINGIYIEKLNYDKPAQYADYVIKSLKAASDTNLNQLTVKYFKDKSLIIDTNMANINNFLAKLNIGYQPRADYGFILYLSDNKLNPNITVNDVSMLQNVTPILAVTGYNEFVYYPNAGVNYGGTPGAAGGMYGLKKYIPFVHVSEVVSLIPNEKILPLAITLAHEVFINKGLWKNPNVNKDTGKLYVDPKTKKPWEPKSTEEIIQFLEMYMLPPLFVVDVVEGKTKIPGLTQFLNTASSVGIDEFNRFFETNISGLTLAVEAYKELAGYINVKGNIKDSREVDYFFLLNNMGYRPEFVRFTTRFDPRERARLIQHYIEFKPMYTNTVCTITPQIADFTKALLNNVRIILTFDQALPLFDFSHLLQFGFTPQMNVNTGMTTGMGSMFNWR